MNKYIWADYHKAVGIPVIKNIIARNYGSALEKIAEMYEDELDEELPDFFFELLQLYLNK